MKTLLIIFSVVLSLNSCIGKGETIPELSGESNVRIDSVLFSSLWMNYQEYVYGYIGNDNERLYVHYDSIARETDRPSVYRVWGKYKAESVVLTFIGCIEIKDVFLNNDEDLGDAAECHDQKYSVLSEWTLELSGQRKGKQEGSMVSYCKIKDNVASFFDCDIFSDSKSNNQFVGEWTDYTDNNPKKCCWGTFRIPECGDLDIGAAEFSPNPKYISFGWESYAEACSKGTLEAWQQEQTEWWK